MFKILSYNYIKITQKLINNKHKILLYYCSRKFATLKSNYVYMQKIIEICLKNIIFYNKVYGLLRIKMNKVIRIF